MDEGQNLAPRPERPAEPPSLRPSVVLTAKQWIGLPFIMAIPLLAALGTFGESTSTATIHSASLSVSVSYPARFRYRQIQALRVRVRNTSPAVLDTVLVSFDTAYVTRFSSVRFDPAPTSAYVISVVHLMPGAEQLVSVELWGEEYGRHHGIIAASARADTARVPIATFVFP
jgi:hypothetical protein